MNPLFTTLDVGPYQLKNRLVMAPMTRSRADDATGVPGPLVPTYYAQRASGGLIITEGTSPSAMGKGYVATPGIYSEAQIAGWKAVTDAVHAKGGLIFLQIMHCGRISHPSMLPNEATPVAPSAIKPAGQAFTTSGPKDFVEPRALTLEEIPRTIEDYRLATKNALIAGFDGVELHAASGYLPEQFLSSGTNVRTDAYGGSVQNRTRFILEALAAMQAEAGKNKVGIKIAPEMGFNDIKDAAPQETFKYLVEQLAPLGLAYLHVAVFHSTFDYHNLFRSTFKGPYLYGAGLTKEKATQLLSEKKADAAVFGSLYLANPDLPERFKRDAAPLNEPDKSTFYNSPGAKGFTDYPTL